MRQTNRKSEEKRCLKQLQLTEIMPIEGKNVSMLSKISAQIFVVLKMANDLRSSRKDSIKINNNNLLKKTVKELKGL